jgi:hypothetical protein
MPRTYAWPATTRRGIHSAPLFLLGSTHTVTCERRLTSCFTSRVLEREEEVVVVVEEEEEDSHGRACSTRRRADSLYS